MGFFDDLKGAAESVAKEVTTMGSTVAIKAKEKTTVFKLKKQIEDYELEISRTYKEIGIRVVEEYKGLTPMEEDTLKDLIRKVDDINVKIALVEKEIAEIEANADETISDIKEKNKF